MKRNLQLPKYGAALASKKLPSGLRGISETRRQYSVVSSTADSTSNEGRRGRRRRTTKSSEVKFARTAQIESEQVLLLLLRKEKE